MQGTCYCQILMKIDFFNRFSKNPQMLKFMKICPVVVELFNADKRKYRKTADRAKLILAFAILLTRLKNGY
jgi:hypothetical protein